MGRTSVYLVPEASDVSAEEYAERVRKFLLETKVVAHDDEEGPAFFYFGPASRHPFQVPPEFLEEAYRTDPAFEFCTIYGGRPTVVPGQPAAEPKCPRCGADVTEPYYDAFGEEEGAEVDFTTLRVTCPGCGGAFRPDALKDHVGIFIVDRFVNFDDSFTELRPEWLAELERQTGHRHKVLVYWYT
jgi:hypothetical protein